jgi:hypothetical protein
MVLEYRLVIGMRRPSIFTVRPISVVACVDQSLEIVLDFFEDYLFGFLTIMRIRTILAEPAS